MPPLSAPPPARVPLHLRNVTPRRVELLRLIAEHMYEHGAPPTLRWLASQLGATSCAAAVDHIRGLEREGILVRVGKGTTRGLRIAGGGLELLGIRCPYCERAGVGHG